MYMEMQMERFQKRGSFPSEVSLHDNGPRGNLMMSQWICGYLSSCVIMFQRLSMENYIQRMSTLLHLEEIQMELDIQEFSMQRVSCLMFISFSLQPASVDIVYP